jgi:hypothetical protein
MPVPDFTHLVTPHAQVDYAETSISAAKAEHSTQLAVQQQPQLSLEVAALKSSIAAGHPTASAALGPWAGTSSSSKPSPTLAGPSSPAAELVEEARRWRNRWLRGLLLCAPGEGGLNMSKPTANTSSMCEVAARSRNGWLCVCGGGGQGGKQVAGKSTTEPAHSLVALPLAAGVFVAVVSLRGPPGAVLL